MIRHRRHQSPVLAVLVVLLNSVIPARASDLVRISEAWVREAPPVATTLAGYAKVENLTSQEIALIGAASADFEAVEFHRTDILNGLARMRKEAHIVIPSRATVSFQPGGRHLMLIRLRRPLKTGDEVVTNFRLSNGQRIRVVMPVRRQAPGD